MRREKLKKKKKEYSFKIWRLTQLNLLARANDHDPKSSGLHQMAATNLPQEMADLKINGYDLGYISIPT